MHLTVIAKQPRAGFVKTRLCPPCTPRQAADIAAAALLDTLDAVDRLAASEPGVDRVLLFDGDPTEWARPGYRVVEQCPGGLEQRLSEAFDQLGPGVVVGMEAPAAVPALTHALRALRVGDDALGLAVDGGYWAIGLHAADRRVFDGIPMSTSSTGLAQLSRLHRLGRAVRLLRCAHDLDTIADVQVAARHGDGRLRAVSRHVLTGLTGPGLAGPGLEGPGLE